MRRIAWLIFLILGCGRLEVSRYKPSPERGVHDPQNSKDKQTPKLRVPDEESSEMDNENEVAGTDRSPEKPQLDLQFDTGLPSCIRNHLGSKIFVPIKLKKTLEDFENFRVTTYTQFETLVDLLLRKVVTPEGLVDYPLLRNQYKSQWSNVIEILLAGDIVLPPSGRQAKEAMVFWTNVYNLLMIEIIVKSPEVKNIQSDLGFVIFDRKWSIAGIRLSLNDIEKGILSLAGSPNKVPLSLKVEHVEPRLHFTLVCGAMSCPKLRNFLYREESIEVVMHENALVVANSTDFFDVQDGFVFYSGLFDFYPKDFQLLYGEKFHRLDEYVLLDCRDDASAILKGFEDQKAFADPYDWTVNSVKR